MTYRVAIVGHSQVPKQLTVNDTNIKIDIFRRPGGCVTHFDESPLRDVLDEKFDLVFLFLGGNDIVNYPLDCKPVSDALKEILLKLKTITNELRFVLIERRNYAPNNRFNLDNAEYERGRKQVNSSLRHFLKGQSIRSINTAAPWFGDHLKADGVHFDNNAQEELKTKIRNAIFHCKADRELVTASVGAGALP